MTLRKESYAVPVVAYYSGMLEGRVYVLGADGGESQ